MLLGKRREQLLIAPDGNNAQLWTHLVVKVDVSHVIKNNIAEEPGMLGPRINANWKWFWSWSGTKFFCCLDHGLEQNPGYF